MRSPAGTHTCRHNRGMPDSRQSSTGSHAPAAANKLQSWGAPVRACVPVRRGPTPVPKQDPALTGLQPQITEGVPRPSDRAGTNAHRSSKSSRACVGVGELPRPGCGTQDHRPWPKGAHLEKKHRYINPPAPLRSRALSHTRSCCPPPTPYSRGTSRSRTIADTPRHVKCRQDPEGAHRSERAPTPMPLHIDPPTLARGSKSRVIYTYPPAPMRSRAGAHTRAGTTGARQTAASV